MANEELTQRGYLASGSLRGQKFGDFEELNIGATTVKELVASGVHAVIPTNVNFPFKLFKPPKSPQSAKPDRVFLLRQQHDLVPVAVGENKAPAKLLDQNALLKTAEQGLYYAACLGVRIAIVSNGQRWFYVDVEESLNIGEVAYFGEKRDFNPGVLHNLLKGDASVAKNPEHLAETVWQIIWLATQEEPKQCLLTFIEIFLLKFLSDNLPKTSLPDAYSFYSLLLSPDEFQNRYGKTAIAYYVSDIRPQIKKLFPDNVIVEDPELPQLFGLKTLVSKTSIINGFAFLRSSEETIDSFNRTFLQILDAFNRFGPLTAIDPEFKLRLYETFLKSTARQQRLGQFFTPRNIVRQMIRMARLGELPDGAIVLDPAAGVGGFVLEPLLIEDALPDNLRFEKGKAIRRVKTVGVDLDVNTTILAKANLLIHVAEAIRDTATTLPALNRLMAETFVHMNWNETLGALENPPVSSIDVILTNPPYVTQGSKAYREEINHVKGRKNGIDLRDYYDRWGLGVESYFMRYISGALKPGGRAFIIVPLGMLNRTESGPKAKLLEECDIVASISLPRNSFFNTAQPTCIFAIEKRHAESDPRPDVFCALVRSIGETLDYRRIPTPEDNDLQDVADLFLRYVGGDRNAAELSPLVKIVGPEQFSPEDRWDVARFWSEEEFVKLGVRESAVERLGFIEVAKAQIGEIAAELEAAREELESLIPPRTKTVSLSDKTLFRVRSGTRITNEQIRQNPGEIPVYSCFVSPTEHKGTIDEQWLEGIGIPIETDTLVTVMANGAKAVGKVFVRRERCVLTDDVIIVEAVSDKIDPDFLAVQLRGAIAQGNYVYEAKLFQNRVKQLSIELPVTEKGDIDVERQRVVALAVNRFDNIRQKLHELGSWSGSARIS